MHSERDRCFSNRRTISKYLFHVTIHLSDLNGIWQILHKFLISLLETLSSFYTTRWQNKRHPQNGITDTPLGLSLISHLLWPVIIAALNSFLLECKMSIAQLCQVNRTMFSAMYCLRSERDRYIHECG